MSMKINKCLTLRDQGSRFIHYLFENAERYGYSQQKMLNEWNEWRVKMNNTKSHYPHWLTSYWNGVWNTLDRVASKKREFCYIMNDGRRVSIRKQSPIHYERLGITPEKLTFGHCDSGFFWIETGNRYF